MNAPCEAGARRVRPRAIVAAEAATLRPHQTRNEVA
jgi:hypothetical protein